MDASKTFVLIVGSNTKSRRAGECTYCSSFDNGKCKTGHTVSNDSFIEYECKKAVRDSENIKLVILYSAATIDKSKCPDAISNDYSLNLLLKLGVDLTEEEVVNNSFKTVEKDINKFNKLLTK